MATIRVCDICGAKLDKGWFFCEASPILDGVNKERDTQKCYEICSECVKLSNEKVVALLAKE